MPAAWRVSADLYWCPVCNVPLIAPKCGLCEGRGVKAYGSPPKDFRPAFEFDLKLLKLTVEKELGSRACEVIAPSGGVVLLNKVPYVDQANEVIVDGWVMGNLYFNPERRTWRFRPSYEGASRLIAEGAAPYVEVKRGNVKLWDVLSKRDYTGETPSEESRYVVLSDEKGLSIGVAVSLGDGRLKAVKVWSPHKPHFRDVKSSWSKAVEANKRHLEAEERRATSFIARAVKGSEVFVSFSGGKDSLVALLLTIKAIGDKPMLFNDTGIEAPATVEHVWDVANRLGLELILASAEDAFWRSLPSLGPPARDYRWCCKVCKLVPIARAVKSRFKGEVYSILGQRKYESFARLRAPMIERSKWIPSLLGVSPIRDWSALHVWLYLMSEKLDTNPLYKEGFDRIGCWLCPACELAEFERIKEVYPSLWRSWEEKALSWIEERGLPQEWFHLGLWRWRRLPGDIKKMSLRIGLDVNSIEKKLWGTAEVRVVLSARPCEGAYEAHGGLRGGVSLARLSMFLKCTGGKVGFSEKLGLVTLKLKGAFAAVSSDGSFSLKAGDPKELEEALKLLVKSLLRAKFCNLCGSCLNWCPTSSIRIDGAIEVLDSCRGCRVCIEACPVATYMYKSSVVVEGGLDVEA
ncbi:MAG: hypothetical protein DRJ68_06035 [Thermoprotei archaeon]|nr:MAG: hypothetical protein DRJ68_06035 [Thermoprotei archaeon]